ncbi:MAG: hypothetical protein IPM57_11955 [Oligoflexia bacterium]|nr:hypothetical protein [Oligoflexia bacterium]
MKYLAIVALILIATHKSFALPQCAKRLAQITDVHVENIEINHSRSDLLKLFGIEEPSEVGIENISQTSSAEIINKVREKNPDAFESAKKDIVDSYAEFSKDKGVTPLAEDMNYIFKLTGLEIDFEKLIGPGKMFESRTELYRLVLKTHKSVKNAVYSELSSPKKRKRIEQAVKQAKGGVIVTSAVNGAYVNKDAMDALLALAERKDAIIIIQVVNLETYALDPYLEKLDSENKRVFLSIDEVRLNEYWNINNTKIMAKQINTLMGLERLWERGTSQIIASPQLRTKSVPTKDNTLFPHYLYTTGAITDPNYAGKLYVSKRTDSIAANDHVVGALYLEKTQYTKSNFGLDIAGNFHPRHLEFLPELKGFIDDGILHTAANTLKVHTDTIVLGDLHEGVTEQYILQELVPLIKKYRKYTGNTNKRLKIVLHDAWDGVPLNHHNKDKSILLAKLASEGKLDIAKSIGKMANTINAILEIDPYIDVVMVRSNHPDWLVKWLQSGSYMRYPHTAQLYNELALAATKGQDPFEYALLNGINGGAKVNKYKRVVFPQGSFKVGPEHRPVEISEHGDKGANGARGSINSFVRGTEGSVHGHFHGDERNNRNVQVGTLSLKEQEFNKGGFSNWSHSIAVISEHGDIQVLIFDRGEFITQPNFKPTSKFFNEGFPQVTPTIKPPSVYNGAGQIDQYK